MNQNKLRVKFNNQYIGTLAMTKDKKIAFQYTESWIENGFSLNPFSLPLTKKVYLCSKEYFNGLFGVFADSLPDSWGNLLVDRYLISKNISLQEVTVFDRLALLADNGMGALSYEPSAKMKIFRNGLSLEQINEECGNILASKPSSNLDMLFQMGGSSGGARPKVMLELEGKPWIIKFSNHIDSKDAGKIEYDYFECARACGINVPRTRLFSSEKTSGFFGIERFDRKNGKKVHMVTVAGILEIDFRTPALDYKDLIKLTNILTNNIDSYEMFRRMCFNVFSHNQDDHTKNFSFLYDEENKCWRLSPAYDLTYSTTYFGEHTTSVNGKGKNITEEDLLQVGLENHLDKKKCKEIIERIKVCVKDRLEKYL